MHATSICYRSVFALLSYLLKCTIQQDGVTARYPPSSDQQIQTPDMPRPLSNSVVANTAPPAIQWHELSTGTGAVVPSFEPPLSTPGMSGNASLRVLHPQLPFHGILIVNSCYAVPNGVRYVFQSGSVEGHHNIGPKGAISLGAARNDVP